MQAAGSPPEASSISSRAPSPGPTPLRSLALPRRQLLGAAPAGALLPALAAPAFGAARRDRLRPHPQNPRIFLWRGQPRLLIGASEHFGAVLNLDVDYVRYLRTIARHGFNVTRIFSGAFVEPSVHGNTLEPSGDRYIAPWARGAVPGNVKGGNKFDLSRFDPAYFRRLRDFVATASSHDIVVDLVFFTPFFDDHKWSVAPFNPHNNTAGIPVKAADVFTLDRHGGLLAVQEALVERLVRELRGFDNVILELNFTRFRSLMSAAWERHMLEVLWRAQRKVGDDKLTALNLGHGRDADERPDPRIGLLAHNLADQKLLDLYRDEARPISMSETGFVPSTDREARFRAWDFVLGGAGLFIHLDHSFSVRDPDARRIITKPDAQFGGGPTQRAQLAALVELVGELDLPGSRPAPQVVTSPLPKGLTARALVAPGKSYLVYLRPARPPASISVRMTGRLLPRVSGAHTLALSSNDGVRLWIDGEQRIDNWQDRPQAIDRVTVQLTKGKSAELRLEYFHVTGAPLLKLEWEAPGLDREVVPVDSLQDPDGKASGLRAEYYAGPSFETKVATLTGQRGEYPGPAPSPFAPPRHEGPLQMTLDVAPGRYRLEWLDPASGGRLGHALALDHVGGPLPLMSPAFTDDLALRLVPGNAANLAFLRGVPRPLRVLALGDSNTARANGYRSPLKSRLDAAGLVTDFVGSKSSGPVDGEHEGYPGEGVARIRERLRQGILSDTRPDVVLLMIGANDLWVSLKDRRPTTDEAAGELVGRFDELLTQLAAQAPSCHVVVAKPTTPTNAARPLELFRAGLDRLVSERREKGQAISLVDCRGAANDGVHFSADGAATLADRFFAELDRVARLPVPRASKT